MKNLKIKIADLLRKIFTRRKDVKRLFPNNKHLIEYAFSVAGVDYYCFNDVFHTPYERGLLALSIYEETRMKCSREYLEKHVEAIRKLLREPKIDIFKINQLNEQMSERLNLAIDADLLYKLASVVYFDKNENPYVYETDYCKKKIEHWKAHKGVADFFLQKPVMELIPSLKSQNFDLDSYFQANMELNRIHSENLSI